MLDSLPSPEVSYLFKRQLLTHHSYESQIPANQIAIRPDESTSRVIGPRTGNIFLIDVEGCNPRRGGQGNTGAELHPISMTLSPLQSKRDSE